MSSLFLEALEADSPRLEGVEAEAWNSETKAVHVPQSGSVVPWVSVDQGE